jgi:hypothetical protein
MKKITLILALIGMITLQSCTKEEVYIQDDGIDYDTISEVLEYTNVDFNPANGFGVYLNYPYTIYNSDMVLVYHLYDVINGQDVWRLMPQTYYFNGGGELDYNFDFTTTEAFVFLDANFDLNTLDASWTQNQIFRMVIIPANFGNRMAAPVDFNDYKAVIEYYNLDDSKLTKIEL